jgi:hypothetical protein
LLDVLLLRADERPDFIALHALAGQVDQRLVLVFGASRANVREQFQHSCLGCARDATRCIDGVALDQQAEDLGAFGNATSCSY